MVARFHIPALPLTRHVLNSRYLSSSLRRFAPSEVSRLTICGAGTMGTGIAHVALDAGLKVTMYDVNPKALE